MGIDIYARWSSQSDSERSEQSASWLSWTAGKHGYLRESYHGAPYATEYLCAEAFDKGEARIGAATLRERLPRTLELVEERQRSLYDADDAQVEEMKQSFRDFVELCERVEQETSEPVLIVARF